MVRVRNSRSLRRTTRPVRKVGRLVNKYAHGVQIRPSADPPSFIAGPWWPITVVLKADSDMTYVPLSLYTAVKEQLSWSAFVDTNKYGIPIEMRLVSVRSWGIGRKPVQLTIYDHLGGKHRIAEISDYGTPTAYSRVGWKFGNIGTGDALQIEDTDPLFQVSGGKTDNIVISYVQLLIRAQNAPKPVTTLESDMDDLELLSLPSQESQRLRSKRLVR